MIPLLLALALQAPESLRDKALRLARDAKANRAELVKLGRAAVRPLLEVRDPEVVPVLRELRLAGAPAAVLEALDDRRLSLDRPAVSPPDLVASLSRASGVPILVDPAIRGSLEAMKVNFHADRSTAGRALERLGSETGTDFAWIRGTVVVSRPERLWAHPPEPPLDEKGAARLREAVARLDDESAVVREEAQEAILSKRGAALAVVDEALRAAKKPRARAILASLRAKIGPPAFVESLAIEREGADDALRDLPVRLEFRDTPLAEAIRRILPEARVCDDAESLTVWADLEGRAIDALYFLTVPYGLDVVERDGQVVVERPR